MDPANTTSPSHLLDTAKLIPIAELYPGLPDPATKAVGGVVTITWPYNKVRGTFAFNLAEPDFRLRRNRGQVRVDFTGEAAEAIGASGLGGNDEVLISLAGAAWGAEAANKRQSLPGADLGWRLVFSDTVFLRIKRAETNEVEFVVVDEQPSRRETAEPPATTRSPSPPAPRSPIYTTSPVRETSAKRFDDGEFASPAFMRRARMSYGSLFEDGFDIFQDDGGVLGRGRKRTRFGRDSSAWRYTSQSPSPEPVASSPEIADELVSSPTRAAMSRARMADEGCQTTDRSPSLPPLASSPLDTQTDTATAEHIPANDVPADAPPDAPTEPGAERRAQTPASDTSHSKKIDEPTIQRSFIPIANDIPSPNSVAPPLHVDQQPGSAGYNLAGSQWNLDLATTAFEPHNNAPFPPSHLDGPPAVSDLGDATVDNQPVQPDDSHSASTALQAEGGEQESMNDGIVDSAELDPPPFNYPPLITTEDIPYPSGHENAMANYPASYLEGGHTSQIFPTEKSPQPTEIAEARPRSWITINNSSTVTAVPSTDRLENRDGDTPEKALVIDESDSDSSSDPEPIAVEDTVNNGRAYPLDQYEDAEAEDELDAQYSDDDEPEYDDDEIGGDYDTRNYGQPGDDDDDSHDEDLRPRSLDPEFDDGESWDEEGQEDSLDDGEGDYEMHEQVVGPDPQPVVRVNPAVIDLISSSEDESEDEGGGESDNQAAQIQESGTHFYPRTSSREQMTSDRGRQVSLSDDGTDFLSQAAISEPDTSSEADGEDFEHATSISGDKRGDEISDGVNGEGEHQGVDRSEDSEASEREDTHIPGTSSKQEEHNEPDVQAGHQASTQSTAIRGGAHSRQTTPKTELHGSIETGPEREILEEDDVIVPLSAADGLEILSRIVDEESNSRSQFHSVESVVETAPAETVIDKRLTVESPQKDDIPMQDYPDNQHQTDSEGVLESSTAQSDEKSQIDQITPSKLDTEHQPLVINDREHGVAAAPSPPLTQTFESHIEDEINSQLELTALTTTGIISAAPIPTARPPTPPDTQTTDIPSIGATTPSIDLAASFESYAPTEQKIYKPKEVSIFEKSVDDLLQESINTDMDKDVIGWGKEGVLGVVLQAPLPTAQASRSSSPTPSFETQVDEEHLGDGREVATNHTSPSQTPFTGHDSIRSDTSESFISDIDVDDELQASILEDSQLEERSDPGVHDDYDEELQASILEEFQLEEHASHSVQDGYDEALQASILEGSELEEQINSNVQNDYDEELQASILEDSQLEESIDYSDQYDDEELQSSILEDSELEEQNYPSVQMDYDEELQASILEDSQLEDGEHDVHDDYDDELQASILEDSQPEDERHGIHDDYDEELQASILEDFQQEEENSHEIQDEDDELTQVDASESPIESEREGQSKMLPFHLHEHTPAQHLTNKTPAQLGQNIVSERISSGEDSDGSMGNDPSILLARAANTSRKKRKRAASTPLYRPRKRRTLDARRSPTPETDDSSIRLARASLGSLPPWFEEESYSMTMAKLQLARHLRDELPDCVSLKGMQQHLTKSVDVIAVATMQPPDPRRARGGPREFMMSFTVSDYSVGPYAVAEALIYRPHRDKLPVVKYGDVVLFRNFTVVSLTNKGFGLRSNKASSWAVFDQEGEPAQIRGPPVEYGETEMLYVDYLREWFGLLDDQRRSKLEEANQKIINAGRSK